MEYRVDRPSLPHELALSPQYESVGSNSSIITDEGEIFCELPLADLLQQGTQLFIFDIKRGTYLHCWWHFWRDERFLLGKQIICKRRDYKSKQYLCMYYVVLPILIMFVLQQVVFRLLRIREIDGVVHLHSSLVSNNNIRKYPPQQLHYCPVLLLLLLAPTDPIRSR